MKESKKYSPKILKLFRTLKQQGDWGEMPEFTDPVEAVVFALMSEHLSDSASDRIYKRMQNHFVDFNDLRVSRPEEIMDVLKVDSPMIEQTSRSITETLNAIYEKHNRVSLELLKQEGKRQAHKELAEIEGITSFAVSYCFLTALDGHAIPLTPSMIKYLHENELIHPDATDEEVAGFLERQIGAADAYPFYKLMRAEAENPSVSVAKTKTTRAKKKKATKKTAKKTTSSKTTKKATKKKTAAKKVTKKKTAKKKSTKKQIKKK